MDRYMSTPDERLVISITKDATTTHSERSYIKGVEPRIFYKLDKYIIVVCEIRQLRTVDETVSNPLIDGI